MQVVGMTAPRYGADASGGAECPKHSPTAQKGAAIRVRSEGHAVRGIGWRSIQGARSVRQAVRNPSSTTTGGGEMWPLGPQPVGRGIAWRRPPSGKKSRQRGDVSTRQKGANVKVSRFPPKKNSTSRPSSTTAPRLPSKPSGSHIHITRQFKEVKTFFALKSAKVSPPPPRHPPKRGPPPLEKESTCSLENGE